MAYNNKYAAVSICWYTRSRTTLRTFLCHPFTTFRAHQMVPLLEIDRLYIYTIPLNSTKGTFSHPQPLLHPLYNPKSHPPTANNIPPKCVCPLLGDTCPPRKRRDLLPKDHVVGWWVTEQKEMSCICEINSMLTGIIMEYALHKFSLFIDVPSTAETSGRRRQALK